MFAATPSEISNAASCVDVDWHRRQGREGAGLFEEGARPPEQVVLNEEDREGQCEIVAVGSPRRSWRSYGEAEALRVGV